MRIDEDLLPERFKAIEALQKYWEGVKIGHTVIVMDSMLKSVGSRRR